MKLACLCPTYKRPQFLANAYAQFLLQTLPAGVEARLFIYDDARQFVPQQGERFDIHTSDRLPFDEGLPAKYNYLTLMADAWGADAYVVWEDDDIFFPWHLAQIATAINNGVRYYRLRKTWTTYGQAKGRAMLEGAAGRFHSSWAFTAEALRAVGGYPKTNRLDFDQQLNRLLLQVDPSVKYLNSVDIAGEVRVSPEDISIKRDWSTDPAVFRPGYCYRWGNGMYHGSQRGEEGYRSLWESLDKLPAPPVETLKPEMDSQTMAVWYNVHQFYGLPTTYKRYTSVGIPLSEVTGADLDRIQNGGF